MAINIQKATINDVETLQNLNYQLFLHDLPYDKFLKKDWALTESGKKYFTKTVTDKNYLTVTAKDDSKLIGYLIGFIWDEWESRPVKTAEIDNMLVLDEYRGKNIGHKLIEFFKHWCKENEVKELFVMAYTANNNAIEFYKKNNFNELSTRLHQTI